MVEGMNRQTAVAYLMFSLLFNMVVAIQRTAGNVGLMIDNYITARVIQVTLGSH
jgi:hypothetical protein